MSERTNAALLHPSVEAMHDLHTLLIEVLDLVDARVPDANTTVGRFVLSLG
jgi:hypothetical protein